MADGTIANGAFALRESYSVLNGALPYIAYYAGTDRQKVFIRNSPADAYAETGEVGGVPVTVTGDRGTGGQAVVVSPAPGEFLAAGFRCNVSIPCAAAVWPDLRRIEASRVTWNRGAWEEQGIPQMIVDQSQRRLGFWIHEPQVIRVRW